MGGSKGLSVASVGLDSPSRDRCSQLAVFAIQPVGSEAAVVWLVEGGVHQVRVSSELQFGALREVVARERQGALVVRKTW